MSDVPERSREPERLLEIVNVGKSFGRTRALDSVSLDLRAGEVHVLAGENGAGKSTLIRILSGVYGDYTGELRVGGRAVRFHGPAQAVRAGIATIHQELSLLPNLSVADNFLLVRAGGALQPHGRRHAREHARGLLAKLGLTLDPDARVETLSLGDRQLVEIARALGQNAKVLIMDEPTSALSEPEVERLFETIDALRAAGTGILYISHRMDEIYRLGDRISVLRDGRCLFTRPAAELPRNELVLAMLGKDLASERLERATEPSAEPLLSVRDLGRARAPAIHGLSFEVRRGEIVGIAGLQGSGAAETVHALFGHLTPVTGSISVDGQTYVPKSPRAAIARGIVLLPSDRRLSVFTALSVARNATLSSLPSFSRFGVIQKQRERTTLAERAPELKLKAPSFSAPAAELSGGNQQKLALLRCLLTQPSLLLLDDPTRGVDVGAKAEIHALFEALSRRGIGILLHSTDLEELCRVCDRVMVLFQGRLVTTVERAELTRERLLAPIMGARA